MLIFGFILFIIGVAVAIYGNYLNNDMETQLESIFSDGQTNSGDLWLYIGIALAVIGVLCIVVDLCRQRSGNNGVSALSAGVQAKWCPNCGTRMELSDVFCTRCGAKQMYRPSRVCGKCGARLENDAAFCPKCGTATSEGAVENVL